MGIIKVRTPSGKVEQVRIQGDSPNQIEQQAILNQFFPDLQSVQATPPSVKGTLPELDLLTASPDEIEEYKRTMRSLNIDPITKQPLEKPTEESLKDPEVDYTSGLRNYVIRAGLANKELPEEKALYLTDVVGADGFRQDKGGRFILTSKGRQKLGLGEGPDLAIDEEGISRFDVADIAGQGGIALGAGIVAGIATGGLGILPAMFVSGGAMALGKVVDESIEYAKGYQRQTAEELRRDVVMEGLLGVFGEGVGRVLSATAGRIFKGSASQAVEEGKDLGRVMVKQFGLKPSIEGAAPGAFSILSRAQAIYEGVIPNKKAALHNVNRIRQELVELGIDKEADLSAFIRILQDDVDTLFRTPEQSLARAQKTLGTEIEAEIARIMAPLRRGEDLSTSLVNSLQDAKNAFQNQADGLFKMASAELGENNRIIPAAEMESLFKDLAGTNNIFKSILRKDVGKIFQESRERATQKLINSGIAEPTEQQIQREMFIAPEKAQFIRTLVGELSYNPQFISTIGGKNINDLSKTIDQSFIDAEGFLMNRIQDINTAGENFIMVGRSPEQLQRGLRYYREAREYYADGLNMFKSPLAQNIIKNARDGKRIVDVDQVLNTIVKSDRPQDLTDFLNAVKGVEPAGIGPERITVRFAGEDLSIEAAERKAAELARAGVDNSGLLKGIEAAQERLARSTSFREAAGTRGETIRQELAGAFLNRVLTSKDSMSFKNGEYVLDGLKVVRELDKLGTTKNVLFRGELQQIKDLSNILRSTGVEINQQTLNEFADRPLVEAIKGLRQATEIQKAVDKDSLARAFNSGDGEEIMNKLFSKKTTPLLRDFMNNNIKIGDETIRLPNHQRLKETVQDEAMKRILRSMGDVSKPRFSDDFLSGKLGNNLEKTLSTDYGEEAIVAMFGKDTSDRLFQLAEVMKRASDQPLKGKGGLAPATIALGLTIFGFMTNPIATLGSIFFYNFMSKALRSDFALKVMTSSRKPGEDLVSSLARDIVTIGSKVGTDLTTSPQGPVNLVGPEEKRFIDQNITSPLGSAVQSAIPNVAPAFGGTPAANVDPTNPIVNPDPATQALAQALSQRPPS